MGRKQSGISLMGLIIGLVILAMLALLGMRLLPSFLEYRSAKTAIEGIARQPEIGMERLAVPPALDRVG